MAMYRGKTERSKKQMGTQLIVSAALMAAGCVIFGLMMAAVIDPFGGGELFGILAAGLFVAGIINYFAGYRSKIKHDNGPKAGMPFSLIAFAVLAAGVITALAVPIVPAAIRGVKNNELNSALQKYVKSEFTAKDAKLPDNPKFVLYDMKTKRFSYPVDGGIGKEKGLCDNPYVAKTPGEATIAIGYEDGGTGTYGYWYNAKTGEKTEDAFTQKAAFYAIRLDDWSLIDAKSESLQLKKGSKGANPRGMVHGYDITYLIENGRFEKN